MSGIDKIGNVTPVQPKRVVEGPEVKPGQQFKDVLAGKMDAIRFSAHAESRIPGSLDPEQVQRLTGAVNRAAAKGCRESVVLMDQVAFVVSVKNRTVITAVPDWRMNEQIFTNIDSAVIVPEGAGPR